MRKTMKRVLGGMLMCSMVLTSMTVPSYVDLYNAINGTNYKNTKHFSITTLEDVVYMGRKNDLSFIVGNILNLYEPGQEPRSKHIPLRDDIFPSTPDYVQD